MRTTSVFWRETWRWSSGRTFRCAVVRRALPNRRQIPEVAERPCETHRHEHCEAACDAPGSVEQQCGIGRCTRPLAPICYVSPRRARGACFCLHRPSRFEKGSVRTVPRTERSALRASLSHRREVVPILRQGIETVMLQSLLPSCGEAPLHSGTQDAISHGIRSRAGLRMDRRE